MPRYAIPGCRLAQRSAGVADLAVSAFRFSGCVAFRLETRRAKVVGVVYQRARLQRVVYQRVVYQRVKHRRGHHQTCSRLIYKVETTQESLI